MLLREGGQSLATIAGVYFSVGQVVDQFVVDADGLNVHLLISYFGGVYPISCVVLQKFLEVDAHPRTR
jgi:hypothetical protein